MNTTNMLSATYKKLVQELRTLIPSEQIINDDLLTYAYGIDASFYSLVPKIVVIVENEDEVIKVVSTCSKFNIPFTFRAAGTSLSGQAISESVLIKLGKSWNKMWVEENGAVVKLQPGISGGEVNRKLKVYNRKLGPDPASSNIARMGGIIANNASGMTSGVVHNSYNTLLGMKIIFYDGSILDSSDPQSVSKFKSSHKEVIKQIASLSQKVKSNKDLSAKIEKKYKIKNTCGYGLNSFTDFSDPIEIIAHLMVGSEGTLGFISEVTLKTVDDFPYKATTFLLFKNITDACKTIALLEIENVDCAELMDYAALNSVKDLAGLPFDVNELSNEAAALLVEISADTEQQLQVKQKNLSEKLSHLSLLNKAEFTFDPLERARIWKIRKGLFPSGCKNRENGSTIIIEDLNFPTNQLAQAVADIRLLLKKYGYTDSFIWGHALSGNIHFVLTQKFDSRPKIENYNNFMQEIVRLVVDTYDGSLKAEHGTGRNMAPFVEYEWGSAAYAVMREVKKIFDPKNIVNPGVLINDDPQIHIQNIKSINEVHPKIDKCTECGFCEKICPSKDFTLTPRQRISLFRRELGNKQINQKTLRQLSKTFKYNVDQTCAVDGMCQTECPVDINVGDWIKDARVLQKSLLANRAASFVASNFSFVTKSLRLIINVIDIVRKVTGDKLFGTINKIISRISFGVIPDWHFSFPAAAKKIKLQSASNKEEILYFPCCINRVFASNTGQKGQRQLFETIENVVASAGFKLSVFANHDDMCCGMAFASKGFARQGQKKSDALYQTLKAEMEKGIRPVLFDTSPCAIHFQEYIRENNKENIEIFDPIEFIYTHLKDRITLQKIPDPVIIHPVCSVKKQGYDNKLSEIAHWCSATVVDTAPVACCGFAGDKGIQIPGLTESALAELPHTELKKYSNGYSSSRMCEIGLTRESGISFNSLFYLIEKSIKR